MWNMVQDSDLSDPKDLKKRHLKTAAVFILIYATLEILYLRHVMAISVNGSGDSPEIVTLCHFSAIPLPSPNLNTLEMIGKTLTGIGVSAELFALGILPYLGLFRQSYVSRVLSGAVLVTLLVFWGLSSFYNDVRQHVTRQEEIHASQLIVARMTVPIDVVSAMNILGVKGIEQRETEEIVHTEQMVMAHFAEDVKTANDRLYQNRLLVKKIQEQRRLLLQSVSIEKSKIPESCQKARTLQSSMESHPLLLRYNHKFRASYFNLKRNIVQHCEKDWTVRIPPFDPPHRFSLPPTIRFGEENLKTSKIMFVDQGKIFLHASTLHDIVDRAVHRKIEDVRASRSRDEALAVYLLPVLVAIACVSLTLNLAMLALTLFRLLGSLSFGVLVYCLILGAVIGKTIHEFPASFSHRIPPSSWVEAISPYVTPTEELYAMGIMGTRVDALSRGMTISLSIPMIPVEEIRQLSMKVRKRIEAIDASREKIDQSYAKYIEHTHPLPRREWQAKNAVRVPIII